MKIGQSSHDLILQKGLGVSSTKSLFQKFEIIKNVQDDNIQSLSPCTRISNNNMIPTIPKSTVPCRYEEMEIYKARGHKEDMARWDWMDDNLFRKFGINGKVTGLSV